jgi:hypothetical protein
VTLLNLLQEERTSFVKIIFTVLVIALASVAVSAQWKKGDEKAEDTSERKSVNGFAGHLIIVEDPKGFIEEWSKPKTPTIKPVTNVKRGEVVGAFVLFAGCKPDNDGVCNSEVDYAVIKPDGSVYAERKSQPLWKEQAPPAQNIQLSRAILGIRIESKDPAGEYKVRAKVSDLNAGITFELETKFRVQ